jgi:hypothetical protein
VAAIVHEAGGLAEEAYVYLVWKKREVLTSRPSGGCLHRQSGGRLTLVPVLVRNRRVNGRPRQEHVAALPSIRTCCLENPTVRARWWRNVEAVLESLPVWATVTTEPGARGRDWRRRVTASLESKVSRPTPEEWAEYDAQTVESLRRKRTDDAGRNVAAKARRKERPMKLRRAAEEAGRRDSRSAQELDEKMRQAMEVSQRATELLRQSMQRFQEQLPLKPAKRAERQDVPQGAVDRESVPPGEANKERRRVVREAEVRRPRKVRI